MNLSIEQLRRFVVLAGELHFTTAAARLHITQQVLSAQIKQLEAAIGVALFTRSTRRVELTEAGTAFLERARSAVDEADAAVRVARRAGHREEVLLACEIDAQWALADCLAGLPGLTRSLDMATVYVLDLAALTSLVPARIDAVAVWGQPPPSLPGGPVTLAVEDVHVVLGTDDPLAHRDQVAPGDLAGHTLWMWPRHSGVQSWDILVDHVRPAAEKISIVGGRPPGPEQERMIGAVQQHGGYTFAPARYLSRVRPADVRGVPLTPPLRMALNLCWRGEPSPGVRKLIDEVHRASP